MAKNFLDGSVSYIEKTSEDIKLRRNALCKHLTDSFKIPRGSESRIFKQVKEEMGQRGINVTKAIFHSDKTVLRTAFRFLASKDPKEKNLLAKSNYASGIHCLIKDNIFSFDDLRKKPDEKKIETEETKKEISDPLQEFQEALQAAYGCGESLVMRIGEIVQQNKNLQDTVATLQSQVDSANALLEKTRALLQKAHAERLETLAIQYPHLQQLASAVSVLSRKEENFPKTSSFPDRFIRPSETGMMKYETPFLRAFSEFRKEEQEEIVEALKLFASEKGGQHPSLRIKKLHHEIEHTPKGSFEFRTSREIRVTWSKLPQKIIIHYVVRKGDVGHQSER